jgi:hypothetical protein
LEPSGVSSLKERRNAPISGADSSLVGLDSFGKITWSRPALSSAFNLPSGIGLPVGLGVAVPCVIHERPHTIWRPLERSLPGSGKGLRAAGFAAVVVWIRRWIGKRYSAHHIGATLT